MLPLGIAFAGLDGFNGLAFGKRWQQSPLEGGAIDELRVFGRQLSPLEVAVLHDEARRHRCARDVGAVADRSLGARSTPASSPRTRASSTAARDELNAR